MKKNNYCELVEKFGKTHTLAYDIEVIHNEHHTSYKSLNPLGSKYDDCVLLSRLIDGAQSFVWFLERNNYKIIKKRGKK